jgi:hypothetical protein
VQLALLRHPGIGLVHMEEPVAPLVVRLAARLEIPAAERMRLTQAGAIKVFTDVRSGRTTDRPGLDSLLDYARKGDTLAVVRLGRLGRSLSELLATVELLRARGTDLLSLEINTASAAGELVFHVFGAIAHFERRLIAECTKDGIGAALARVRVDAKLKLQEKRTSESQSNRLECSRLFTGRGLCSRGRGSWPVLRGTISRLSVERLSGWQLIGGMMIGFLASIVGALAC